jgi:antitoxin (DNA-binding transcriptional repressor) of toxin-antitoxin stability system
MSTITAQEIEQDPAAFLRRIEQGESLLVTRGSSVVAEVKAVPAPLPQSALRPFGLCAGQFTVPDDFDDPLPEEVIQDFEGP